MGMSRCQHKRNSRHDLHITVYYRNSVDHFRPFRLFEAFDSCKTVSSHLMRQRIYCMLHLFFLYIECCVRQLVHVPGVIPVKMSHEYSLDVLRL